MKDSKLLINTALVSTFFERKRNYFDIYLPFIIDVFEIDKQEEFNIEEISKKLKNNNIELPINSLKNIITNNKIIFNIRKESKLMYVSLLEKSKEIKQDFKAKAEKLTSEINSLYGNFKKYAKYKYTIEYDEKTIGKNIHKFLKNHLLKTILFLGNENERFDNRNIDKTFDQQFINFLQEDKNELLEFEQLCKGYVLLNELKNNDSLSKKPSSFSEQILISLDTNIIFSLLELHSPIINQATKELFELIKKHQNIKPYVTSQTIDEFCHLLDNFDYRKNDLYGIEVDSVFWYMKQKNYGVNEILKLKEEIGSRLKKEYNIAYKEIENWNDKYNSYYKDINDQLRGDRPEHRHNSIETDAINICHVLIHKNKSTEQINKVKYIFLTSSNTLFSSYRRISTIKQQERYPSVITDVHLTNILYRHSNNNKGLTINHILKSQTGYFIVNKDIWKNYIKNLKQLLKNKDIEYEDYARLINNREEIKNFLIEANFSNNENEIGEEAIESLLEKLKKNETGKDNVITSKEDEIKFLKEENRKTEYDLYCEKTRNSIEKQINEEWNKIKKDWWFLLSFLILIPYIKDISKYILPEEKIKNSYKLLFGRKNYQIEFEKNRKEELKKEKILSYTEWKNKKNSE